MWNLKVQFERIEDTVAFLNKIGKIKKISYHIEKEDNLIFIQGDGGDSKEIVLEILSESIAKTYKTAYFFNNISLSFLPKSHREALIEALIQFDIESDIYYIMSLIYDCSMLIISSFKLFKLNRLKSKWNEFVFIANLNGNYLLNYEVYIEFLKFLITSIQPKISVVNLKSDLSKFLIFDDKNHLIKSHVDLKDEMGLITNLVLLAPKNINIHCVGQVSEKTFKTLCYLFDKKINLMV